MLTGIHHIIAGPETGRCDRGSFSLATGVSMSMAPAMAIAMAIMCRTPARRIRMGSGGG